MRKTEEGEWAIGHLNDQMKQVVVFIRFELVLVQQQLEQLHGSTIITYSCFYINFSLEHRKCC